VFEYLCKDFSAAWNLHSPAKLAIRLPASPERRRVFVEMDARTAATRARTGRKRDNVPLGRLRLAAGLEQHLHVRLATARIAVSLEHRHLAGACHIP